jgi:hypothetical protein
VRLHLGAPPSIFISSRPWNAVVEPSPTQLARRGLLLGALLGALVSGLWHVCGISVAEQLASLQGIAALATFLLALVGLFAVHEAVHALLHPGYGVTNQTVVGASFRPLLLYAAYVGTMSRNRYAAMLLAPFLVLSVLPMSLCAVGLASDLFTPMVAALTVANAASSGVDLLGTTLLLSQVPRHAVLQNDGWQTYWRSSDA